MSVVSLVDLWSRIRETSQAATPRRHIRSSITTIHDHNASTSVAPENRGDWQCAGRSDVALSMLTVTLSGVGSIFCRHVNQSS